ncbi:M48 family metalloprotease [Streptomyces sp. MS1.AVA.1]|uniref:M48 family metalloprotease n=1 Tax=Streptomyces machairae TaxID=3134109 RepID=A0ABU8USD4_9ACTN
MRGLTPEQLAAVLEHERGHVVGRHHLALAAAQAFHSVFRRLPLARHGREQTALLLEMVADDCALRRHSGEALATAMYEMAAARTPKGAFAARRADGTDPPSASARSSPVPSPCVLGDRGHRGRVGSAAATARRVPPSARLIGSA